MCASSDAKSFTTIKAENRITKTLYWFAIIILYAHNQIVFKRVSSSKKRCCYDEENFFFPHFCIYNTPRRSIQTISNISALSRQTSNFLRWILITNSIPHKIYMMPFRYKTPNPEKEQQTRITVQSSSLALLKLRKSSAHQYTIHSEPSRPFYKHKSLSLSLSLLLLYIYTRKL